MSLTEETANGDEFKYISEVNFQRIHHKITKIGYADGLADSREGAFQCGFDQGWKDGLRTGFEIQKYKAVFENCTLNKCQDDALLREKEMFDEMEIPETKSFEHCQYKDHKEEDMKTISKAQQQYIDDFLEKSKRDLPLVSKLFIT